MKKKISKHIREKFINPVLHSRAPVPEVSLGVAVGIFMGFTPTVGVQMYLVAFVWTIYRYVFGRHFTLPIGVAMVWISNPFTMVPMYYVFLITGYIFFDVQHGLSYQHFAESLSKISQTGDMMDNIAEGTRFLLVELGWPMVIGSFVYAVPFSIISYYLTKYLVTSHRKSNARLEGISYDEWKAQYETDH
tara:strand:+ start:708 stop:1277 length:570 start_codon:yes stop_codon:yes gene_type:complete